MNSNGEKIPSIVKTEPGVVAVHIKEECGSYSEDSDEVGEEELEEESVDIFDVPVKEEQSGSNCGERVVNDVYEDSSESRNELSALQKAVLMGTCMSFLESSSSDDDDEDILLLWLLCMSKKKKLTKRLRRK